jgi:hypothetical protein
MSALSYDQCDGAVSQRVLDVADSSPPAAPRQQPKRAACGWCSLRIAGAVALTVLLLAIGGVGIFGGEAIATLAMQAQLVLINSRTQLFRTWQDTANMDIRIHRRFFFYNLTNPREVYFDRVTPRFRVIGPFWFNTHRRRPLWSIFWDTADDVGFRYEDALQFDPARSVDELTGRALTLGENITTINMPLFSATYRVSKMPDFVVNVTRARVTKQDVCLMIDLERLAAEHRALGPKGIFTTHTAREWLFGFPDATLQMLHEGNVLFGIEYHVPVDFMLQFNVSIPAPGRIDYRHGQVCPLANDPAACNTSTTSDSIVRSGRRWLSEAQGGGAEYDLGSVGTLTRWANNDRLWWFGADGDCQRLRGTEGFFFGANVRRSSKPEIFVDDLYRSVKLSFDVDSSVLGVPTLRFRVSHDDIALGPDSACYGNTHHGMLLNLTLVAFAPGLVTGKYAYPMRADEAFRAPVHAPPWPVAMFNYTFVDAAHPNGVHIADVMRHNGDATGGHQNDDARQCSSFVDVHALTGSTLAASSRLQINAILEPIHMDGCANSFSDMSPQQRTTPDGSPYTSYFPQTTVPVLYIDREAEAPQPVVNFLKSHVITPLLALRVLGYVCLAAGLLAALVLARVWWRSA